jgi:hypothetical protein
MVASRVPDDFRLRVITVSTEAALRTAGDDQVVCRAVTGRSRELLADLERTIRSNGADARVLAGIAQARRDLG